MAVALYAGALSFAPAVPAVQPVSRSSVAVRMETTADLENIARKLNPKLGYYDPLCLADADFWGKGDEATIGWLRHSEIKHGRIAMFAFVGYCVQANGFHFPLTFTTSGLTYADISAAGSPPEQFDALPTNAKLQILAAIGLLEAFGEDSATLAASGEKHYMKGGKPGFYPSLKSSPGIPHPMPFDLFDPFGLSKGKTAEQKERGLLIELNNGRLAMIGIFGFLAEQKGPGSVPALTGVVPPYAGEPMAYFSASDSSLPFVTDMVKWFGNGAFPGF